MEPRQLHDEELKDISFTDLVNYIEETHHTYVKQVLPELEQLITQLIEQKETAVDCIRLQHFFQLLEKDLLAHLNREEKDTFRLVRDYDENPLNPKAPILLRMVETLESEHDVSKQIYTEIRDITNEYQLPEQASEQLQSTYQKLSELEKDLERHIYLEDDVLFVRLVRELA